MTGIAFASLANWISTLAGLAQYTIVGATVGVAVGVIWVLADRSRSVLRIQKWRVTEVALNVLGQQWKLVSSDVQRRTAWRILIEVSTRIATQEMRAEHGDDGIALRSLYTLFTETRKIIAELEPEAILPNREAKLTTVESFALAMLNNDIRPFLSEWHPSWDVWRSRNPNASCLEWPEHLRFRAGLTVLQNSVRAKAEVLGEIIGLPRADQVIF